MSFERPRLMGVLNVTPDSFSDGGRHATEDAAVAHGLAMMAEGADLLDVGGESTRPGSDPVPAAEQIRRVVPVIRRLAREGCVVSVDTTSAEVARAALASGAEIINDISAFRFDSGMLPLLVEAGVPAIAMHTLGPPKTMQREVHYRDVVAEVLDHLRERLRLATEAGVAPDQLAIDPGLGFGKGFEHNLRLLAHTDAFASLGHPVLVGASRKSFIGRLTGREAGERVMGTAGAVALAVALGAHLLRVHDVAAMREVIAVADAVARAR